MKKTFEKKGLRKKSENISEWYHDVVLRAGLADYSEVKGSMIIKPYGYAIWEKVQATLDAWFKADGVQNAYFPLFIPMHLLQKEKEHIVGFSPELAVVTHAGGEELAEPLAVRPTSETIMYKTFADWIQSYRDLPLKINQWCNIVRWEKRTYPFLRTSEFLWQEGHTVHQNEEEAIAMALKALEWYRRFYEEYFAISVYAGVKSEQERFAGAKTTYAVELVIPDGKALQGATSHDLSDHFARVFEIQFLDEFGAKRYPRQTSWGLSTRSVGGLILSHGDDAGLIVPPRVAPHQVVVLAVMGDGVQGRDVEAAAARVVTELQEAEIRAVLDADTKHTLGYRINDWEIKGVPLRLEIGAREVEKGTITAVRRDTFLKESIRQEDAVSAAAKLLNAIQADLLARSEQNKKDRTVEVESYAEFKEVMEKRKSFIRVLWCERVECERRIKEETKATPRVLELDRMDKKEHGACIACDNEASHRWLFAQSY